MKRKTLPKKRTTKKPKKKAGATSKRVQSKSPSKSRLKSVRAKDVPVTQEMLYGVRNELKHDIKSLDKRLESRFNKVDARFSEMEARFDKVDSRFSEMEARFDKVDARFSEMEARFDKVDARFLEMESKFSMIFSILEKQTSEISRLGVLIEEQNARNKVVLDGYAILNARFERLENDVADIKKTLASY